MKPRPWRVLFPLTYMAGIFLVSSIPDTPHLDEPAARISLDWLPGLLQNILHVPLFGILALLWGWSLRPWTASARVGAALVVLIPGSYAVLDELHQGTVPGRQVSSQDVLLDLVGVIVGAWISWRWFGHREPSCAMAKEKR